MKIRMPILCGIVLVLLATAANAGLEPYLNLDFEDGQDGKSPTGWYAGGEGYTGAVSTTAPHQGEQCLMLSKTDPASNGFGVGTGSFPIAHVAGHRITYTGWIRTAGVTEGYAGLWWRVDGPDGMLAFDNMMARGVKGDTEWTQYTIELDVGAEVTNINFGCLLPGNGTAWFDDLQVLIDGELFVQDRPEPFAANAAQVAWIKEAAHPFATDDPSQPLDDLEFLRDMVGDARIVALGEGTHGTAEFFRMKHRVLRYLATEMGFTLFAIEATMPESERLNAYVLGGEGDPAELIAGMYFWTWKTEEVLAMVEWMREFNAQGDRLEFHGNDMQSPGQAMVTALDLLRAHAPDLVVETAEAYAELRGLARAAQTAGRRIESVPDRVGKATAKVCSELEARRDELMLVAPAAEIDWGIQNARLVDQYCRLAGGGFAVRDEAMADNSDWLLNQAGPDAKMVIWAHNGHVSREGYSSVASMGRHLAERHGSNLFVMGFCFAEGTYTAMKRGEGLGQWGTSPARPGTAEWAFQQTGEPRLVLDLRAARAGSAESGWVAEPVEFRSIGAMAMDDAFSAKILADHYDALIYFEQSTPSVQLDVERPSSWAMWD